MTSNLHIGILGAGAIGGYLGIRLSAAGAKVTLIGRSDLVQARPDFLATDLAGEPFRPGADLIASTDAAALEGVDICLITVKSADSAEVAASATPFLRTDTTVVSLQNGVRNTSVIAEVLGRPVVPGMLTYNVRREAPGRFRRATSGPIMVGPGRHMEALAELALRADEPFEIRPDMAAVQFTKLLLNLNNGLCAVTGLSIAESIRSREVRRCYAACMKEGLAVAHVTGQPLTRIGLLAPPLVARLLTVPNFLFTRLAKSMMAIDPAARSSTLQDLDRGKATEIDYLNGEIVRLGLACGVPTPANAFVTEQVHLLERSGAAPLHFLSPAKVWETVRANRR